MKKRQSRGRKLLVATAGLATLSYVACKKQDAHIETMPVGNLPAPMPNKFRPEPPATATVVTPTTPVASGSAAVVPEPVDPVEMPVGNLPAPMPVEQPTPKKQQ